MSWLTKQQMGQVSAAMRDLRQSANQDQSTGMNTFDGFLERAKAVGIDTATLTQEQIKYAVEWERRTGRKVTSRLEQAQLQRQETAPPLQARKTASQLQSVHQQHSARSLQRLTAAVVALARR